MTACKCGKPDSRQEMYRQIKEHCKYLDTLPIETDFGSTKKKFGDIEIELRSKRINGNYFIADRQKPARFTAKAARTYEDVIKLLDELPYL